ncbi:MAG: hypothetical protein IJ815_00765 [Lachnospiraceae bacterium]|nr:hypothetical protein [Lachnospiraceae bacterium]
MKEGKWFVEVDNDKVQKKSGRIYGNVCLCKRCKTEFMFSKALAQKAAFGLTNKICPNCGSSNITFIKFEDSDVRGFVDRYRNSFNN